MSKKFKQNMEWISKSAIFLNVFKVEGLN